MLLDIRNIFLFVVYASISKSKANNHSMKELLETTPMITSCGCFNDDVADLERFSTEITPLNFTVILFKNVDSHRFSQI